MADPTLSPRPALSDVGQPQPGGGVTICELRGLGMATMQARKGQYAFLRERIRQHFLLELPDRPAIARAGEHIPLARGAAGQALLAFMRDDKRASLLRSLARG